MKKISILLFLLLGFWYAHAQSTQTIKGFVLDADLKFPLLGAHLGLFKDSVLIQGAKTDDLGQFKFENVLPAKYQIKCSYIGYQARTLAAIEVTTGKQTQLIIELVPSSKRIQEVVISASKMEVNNEMALVSARTTCSCPTSSVNVFGRHFLASASVIARPRRGTKAAGRNRPSAAMGGEPDPRHLQRIAVAASFRT